MLAHLSCRGFRNLEPLDWRPGAGSHLLLGANGAGKTSLLEAVYTLATTKSFRTPRLEECCRHGGSSWRLAGEIEGERRVRLEVAWTAEGGRSRAVNGAQGPLAEHLAVQPVVAWTADDVELLKAGPRPRRRLMSQGVVSLRPPSVEALTRYRRSLGQKRELLAGGGGGLSAWNAVVAGAAAEIIRLRAAYVERLARALAAVAADEPLGLPPIELVYRPSPAAGLGGEEAVLAAFERAAAAERRRRIPLVGPHRDDLEIVLGEHEARRVASAGEAKALGLLLLVARARVLREAGREPLLLVDDADAELDARRLAGLWRILSGDGQVVASSSRPEVWRELAAGRCWRLSSGRLEELGGGGGRAG